MCGSSARGSIQIASIDRRRGMVTNSASEAASTVELSDSPYPLSHLGMRSAREVEMKMKMARRMSL